MYDKPDPDGASGAHRGSIIEDDDPLEELRRIRTAMAAEFGGDAKLQRVANRLARWAAGLEPVAAADPFESLEPELRADLSWLLAERDSFIGGVRVNRSVEGKHAPDLDAYNEDARRRARALGFPEESFVVNPSDFPPNINTWLEQVWGKRCTEPAGDPPAPARQEAGTTAGRRA